MGIFPKKHQKNQNFALPGCGRNRPRGKEKQKNTKTIWTSQAH